MAGHSRKHASAVGVGEREEALRAGDDQEATAGHEAEPVHGTGGDDRERPPPGKRVCVDGADAAVVVTPRDQAAVGAEREEGLTCIDRSESGPGGGRAGAERPAEAPGSARSQTNTAAPGPAV